MQALIQLGHLDGPQPGQAGPNSAHDTMGAASIESHFVLTGQGELFLADFGLPHLVRGRPIRHHVDPHDQAYHHLSGAIGRAIMDRLIEGDWVKLLLGTRVVTINPAGWQGLQDWFGIEESNLT